MFLNKANRGEDGSTICPRRRRRRKRGRGNQNPGEALQGRGDRRTAGEDNRGPSVPQRDRAIGAPGDRRDSNKGDARLDRLVESMADQTQQEQGYTNSGLKFNWSASNIAERTWRVEVKKEMADGEAREALAGRKRPRDDTDGGGNDINKKRPNLPPRPK